MSALFMPLTQAHGSDYMSPERLQGEFSMSAYRFAPATGSLKSMLWVLFLFIAVSIVRIVEKQAG
jgi:hypothetical protein